jgi:hypothetical protein
LVRQELDTERRVRGPDDPKTAASIYTLGCLAALQGRRNDAVSLLREAVDHGLPPSDDLGMEKDTELESLQGDPGFAALVAYAKQHAAQPEHR